MKIRLHWSVLLLLLSCIGKAQPIYTIPVVVHVLHTGGPENITDAQVLDAITTLNDDFNKANPDLVQVYDDFRNNIADMQIVFKLAKIDPNGNCTNGIEHIYSSQTLRGTDELSKINQWPPNKYLNIWVYRRHGVISSKGTAPWVANLNASYDGVSIVHNSVGSIGTSSSSKKRAITAAVAGYLGLLSTIENGCAEDSVADTPRASYVSCDSDIVSSCILNSTEIENTQNFMANTSCGRMFTNGQKQRVHAFLNSAAAGRSNLHTSANLLATGVNSNAIPCKPIADFYTDKTYACKGDSVLFVDASYNGNVVTRLWQFGDANIPSSTDSAIKVFFFSPGWQQVSLTVTNAVGSSSTTKQLVYVYDGTIRYAVPTYLDFESVQAYNDYWEGANIDGDATSFTLTSNVSRTGNSCVMLNNYDSERNGNIDELYTPMFDCSTLTTATAKLNFWYSYASIGQGPFKDSLVVYATKDCGQNWVRIYSIRGDSLINIKGISSPYTPSILNDWKRIRINIPNTPASSNFRVDKVSFKIQVFSSAEGNNLYIDDFSIGDDPVGIEEANPLAGVNLMPNPFADKLQISNVPNGEYELSVNNLHGQMVLQQKIITEGNINVDLAAQPAGVYLVSLQSGEAKITIRAVKQ